MIILPFQGQAQSGVDKATYLAYAQETGDHYLPQVDSLLEAWRKRSAWDKNGLYRGKTIEAYLAALYANLYDITGDRRYLTAVKEILIDYAQQIESYESPSKRIEYANGTPAVPDFFQLSKYARAYEILKPTNTITQAEQKLIESSLSSSANFILVTQEWGPMNRAMLRAEGLLYVAKLLPDHANHDNWKQYGETLANDNLKNWSIEDAGMYQLIWMYSVCGYATQVKEDLSILKTPQFHYYFEYLKQLHSPLNNAPDFGDSRWMGWSRLIVPVMELGADIYNDEELRWIAEQHWKYGLRKPYSIDNALRFSEACLWGDFELKSSQPLSGSAEVLDDQIGKKVVFRENWSDSSTYMLLNYKDEGDGGWLFRENLRNTLSVDHEKAHHGHADENSIVSLVHNGSVLLKDGGYRDKLPSGPNGSFRADIFHNRLVWRNGTLNKKTAVFESLKNDGFYHAVNTKKIDFLTSPSWDMSRTRVSDEKNGIQHDRIVNYLKEIDAFVVFDVVKCLRNNDVILANLWHTQYVNESSKDWFLTRYDAIGKWKNKSSTRLLVHFPMAGNTLINVEDGFRSKQTELVISNAQSYTLAQGDIRVFTTVLFPVDKEDPHQLVTQVSPVKTGKNGIAVSIRRDGKEYMVGHKLDLEKDLVREWPRPKYTWESGQERYGAWTTDGHAIFSIETKDSLSAISVGTTRIDWKKRVVFQQAAVTNEYRIDGGPPTNAPWKVRWVERTIVK